MATIAIAAGLVVLGHLFASRGEMLGYDSTFYIAMIDGQGATVPGPFKFRVLVPFIASLLPATPANALLIISYVSLFGSYLLILRACETLGLELRAAAFGLFAIWGSTWHLYHYFNPYMTDAFALMALSAMVLALLRNWFWPFAIAGVAGTFGRETTAFLIPAWLATRQVTRTLWLIAAAALVVALPRYWLARTGDLTIGSAFNSTDRVFELSIFLRQLFTVWGFVWLVGTAGAWFLPRGSLGRLAAAFAALFLSALAATTIATDMGRMFGFLAPLLAIGAAQFYAETRRHSTTLAWLLVGVIAVQGLFNAPEVMFDRGAWIVGWPRRTFLMCQLAVLLLIAWRLGNPRSSASHAVS